MPTDRDDPDTDIVRWLTEPGTGSTQSRPGAMPVKPAAEITEEFLASHGLPNPAARTRAGEPLLARTLDEAQLYLDLRPCPRCGAQDAVWDSTLVELNGAWVRSYARACPVCGTGDAVPVRLPEPGREPASTGRLSFGGDRPSELLDAGEWLWVADLAAGHLPVEDPAEARANLEVAAAAMEEVLKFLPAIRTAVPPYAFWSGRGRQVRDREPGRFERQRLVSVRDSYLRQLRARGIPAVATVATTPVSHDWSTARGPLVAEINELLAALDEAHRSGRLDLVAPYADRLDVLRHEYVTLLPHLDVSRCPYTGVLVRWPIDAVDLDGWFWRHHAPARLLPAVPGTWRAMTGAVRLGTPVAAAPFLCRPGPGAPFVLPQLLRDEQTTAVVSQLAIGPHTGWAVTYYSTAAPGPPVNLWGSDESPVPDGAGGWAGWAEEPPGGLERDFALEPWLATGRLRWIAPDDPMLVPRRGAGDCPFLGIEGPRESPSIQNGRVRR